jgi:L-asparagine permease
VPQSTPTDVHNPTAPSTAVDPTLSAEGYKKSLSGRQVTMIAMGGAIGVGLFMGAGGRLAPRARP